MTQDKIQAQQSIDRMRKVYDDPDTPDNVKELIKPSLQKAEKLLKELQEQPVSAKPSKPASAKEVVKRIKKKAKPVRQKKLSPSQKKTLQEVVRDSKKFTAYKGTSESDLQRDAARKALPPGKRESADGNIYYEGRPNRTDVNETKPYLEKGGKVRENFTITVDGRVVKVNDWLKKYFNISPNENTLNGSYFVDGPGGGYTVQLIDEVRKIRRLQPGDLVTIGSPFAHQLEIGRPNPEEKIYEVVTKEKTYSFSEQGLINNTQLASTFGYKVPPTKEIKTLDQAIAWRRNKGQKVLLDGKQLNSNVKWGDLLIEEDTDIWGFVGLQKAPDTFSPRLADEFEIAIRSLMVEEDKYSSYYRNAEPAMTNLVRYVDEAMTTTNPVRAHQLLQDIGICNYKTGMLINTDFLNRELARKKLERGGEIGDNTKIVISDSVSFDADKVDEFLNETKDQKLKELVIKNANSLGLVLGVKGDIITVKYINDDMISIPAKYLVKFPEYDEFADDEMGKGGITHKGDSKKRRTDIMMAGIYLHNARLKMEKWSVGYQEITTLITKLSEDPWDQHASNMAALYLKNYAQYEAAKEEKARINEIADTIAISGTYNEYHVTIEYRGSGKPQTKNYTEKALSPEEAVLQAEFKVRRLRNFEKIDGGSAQLITKPNGNKKMAAGGAISGRKYDVISPDGFSIHPSDLYNSPKEARQAFKDWRKGYERQGYYSSSTKHGRINLDDLAHYTTIVVLDGDAQKLSPRYEIRIPIEEPKTTELPSKAKSIVKKLSKKSTKAAKENSRDNWLFVFEGDYDSPTTYKEITTRKAVSENEDLINVMNSMQVGDMMYDLELDSDLVRIK